ncbi:hypothetical protein PTKIN_Ptkin12aG0169300 [Pterospermum kingtungense]
MNIRGLKFMRFQDWSSDDGSLPMKVRPSLNAAMDVVRRVFEKVYERIRSLKKPTSFPSLGNSNSNNKRTREKLLGSRKIILNPQGHFLQTWNKLFLLSSVFALAVDPLFFYISVVDGGQQCLNLDGNLEKISCTLRTLVDAFYILHMIFQFRTAFVAPSSRVFGRGELIEDPRAIAKRYLFKNFFVDILSILPLPQIVILFRTPLRKRSVTFAIKESLKWIIFCQYVPRIIRVFPLYKEVTRTSGILFKTAWAGAVLNLILYMLASHAFGAFWYLIAIERQERCWRKAIPDSERVLLYCDYRTEPNATLVDDLKNVSRFVKPDDIEGPDVFNFGIFFDALASADPVVETWYFPKKFFYCFWWGLRNLSSLGQSLETSTFVGEILFACLICVAGLVLFALLIGNMQKYLQSTGVRVEEMRVKRQDAEQWMSHRMLPENLRDRIRQYEQYKWQETRGVDEGTLISNLPKDLKRDINRHLCLNLLKKVQLFAKMDEQLLDAVCDRLKPALYTDKSYIVREGDPVEEMLFIIRGKLISSTTNGGRTGFFNAAELEAGDFCGDDLLTWALDPQSTPNLPISTRTVQALKEVEAFALVADDLKFVASQFQRLHSKQFRHAFKFHSVRWRTWAAGYIQVAWRRHCQRKLYKALREVEDKLQQALAEESEISPSLGATLYASKFAAKALKTLRANGSQSARLPQRVLPLLPQKPAEPNFNN